jgi:hypothetical protein
LECFRIDLFVEPHPQKPHQRKYKDRKALENDLPRLEAANEKYECDMIIYNEMVLTIPSFSNSQKNNYLAVRNIKTFSPSECNNFRERYLLACNICSEGACWCHYCGPLLVTSVPKNRQVVLQSSRLHPINKEENHLICLNCFNNKFSSVSVAPQAIKLSNIIKFQLEVYFSTWKFLFPRHLTSNLSHFVR